MTTAVLPSGLMMASPASRPSGRRERRSRMEARTGSTLFSGFSGFRGFNGFTGFTGFDGFGGFGGFDGFGGGELNKSRKRSSRNLGVRGVRSTRAIWPGSVRWPVSKSRYVPSGLHAMLPASVLARKLTGRGGPGVSTETRLTLMNDFAPIVNAAIHLPFGDQTGVGELIVSAKIAVAITRSAPDPMSRTCSSLRLRRNARCDPSGENTGDRSVADPDVSARSRDAAKS